MAGARHSGQGRTTRNLPASREPAYNIVRGLFVVILSMQPVGLCSPIREDHMSIPPISDLLYEDTFTYPLALILAPILSPVWIIRIGPQGCRRIRALDFRDLPSRTAL